MTGEVPSNANSDGTHQGGSAAYPPGAMLKGLAIGIAYNTRERVCTDKILSPYWILVLVLVPILVSVFMLGVSRLRIDLWIFASGGYSALSLLAVLVQAYLVYQLVQRQNRHYSREARLRAGIIDYIRSGATSSRTRDSCSSELAAMGSNHAEGLSKEKQRSPLLWVVLIIIAPTLVSVSLSAILYAAVMDTGMHAWTFLLFLGLVPAALTVALVLYMFVFLGRTMYEHSARWTSFSTEARSAIEKLGHRFNLESYGEQVLKRNLALYVAATVLTLGVFLLYWLYALIKDPNTHFRRQWIFEDELNKALA